MENPRQTNQGRHLTLEGRRAMPHTGKGMGWDSTFRDEPGTINKSKFRVTLGRAPKNNSTAPGALGEKGGGKMQ